VAESSSVKAERHDTDKNRRVQGKEDAGAEEYTCTTRRPAELGAPVAAWKEDDSDANEAISQQFAEGNVVDDDNDDSSASST
jgi:hypothetical protein